jgi:hypothetical protein
MKILKGLQVIIIMIAIIAIIIRSNIDENIIQKYMTTVNCISILFAVFTIFFLISIKAKNEIEENESIPRSLIYFDLISYILLFLGGIISFFLVKNNVFDSFGNDIISIIGLALSLTADILSDIFAVFFLPHNFDISKKYKRTL